MQLLLYFGMSLMQLSYRWLSCFLSDSDLVLSHKLAIVPDLLFQLDCSLLHLSVLLRHFLYDLSLLQQFTLYFTDTFINFDTLSIVSLSLLNFHLLIESTLSLQFLGHHRTVLPKGSL